MTSPSSRELAEAFSPATIAGLVDRLYELRGQVAALEGEERNLTTIIREYMEATGEVIEGEAHPPCRLVEMSRGWTWDSTAVRNLIDKHPEEWTRLVELGAVQLNSTVVKQAISQGQLLGRPMGGLEKRTASVTFDKPKRGRA